ncbi:hypothetical protein PPERSA_02403 [Pseudocohnilembus persalinus]|uniref:Small ribosomal subunit protein mS41 n=1 Tax=Pseudocohnilembus persalinus TaxID=266149 RepID=A0A0V0QBE7_PSEPJ|nr:hypothetical protein PPERSA_02403 [Pseudocohnilembus persalinus]|eukprot:KRW99545.1 hypothetical protein PPERSA_02403 [Pseudocohnilembus persalinus]
MNSNILKSVFTLSSQKIMNFKPQYFLRKYPVEPKLRRRTVTPIYPPPGLNLQIPEWEVEMFMKRIGGGCNEIATDKFETLQEVFESDSKAMKEKGIPPKIRRYILDIKEQLRRGVLTFEYLERRTVFEKTPSAKQN